MELELETLTPTGRGCIQDTALYSIERVLCLNRQIWLRSITSWAQICKCTSSRGGSTLATAWSSHCISSKCWQQCSTETWISTTLHWLQMCPLLAILEEPNTLWRWLNEKIKIILTYVSLTNMVEVPFTEPKWTEGCLPHSLSTCVLHTELSSDQMPPCIVPSSE